MTEKEFKGFGKRPVPKNVNSTEPKNRIKDITGVNNGGYNPDISGVYTNTQGYLKHRVNINGDQHEAGGKADNRRKKGFTGPKYQ